MSASRMPTFSPSSRSASARLTAVVDLPTPPLPEAMAMMACTPGIPDGAAPGGAPGRGRVAGETCGRAGAPRADPALPLRSAVSATSLLRAPTNGFPRLDGGGINRNREEDFTVGDNDVRKLARRRQRHALRAGNMTERCKNVVFRGAHIGSPAKLAL